MKKQILKSGFFLKCLMVLLAIGWCTSTMRADVYYHVELIPVLENGATGLVFSCPYASANFKYNNYLYNIGKENKWSTHFNGTFDKSSGNPDFYIMAAPGNDHQSIFAGWYWDAECTEPIKAGSDNYTYCKNEVYGSSWGRTLTSYASASIAEQPENVIKIYAKFVRTTPAFDWSTVGETPVDGKKYYIYSTVLHKFLQAPKGSPGSSNRPNTTINLAEATLFTYDLLGEYTKNTCYDDYGIKENRSYKECTLTYQESGETRYASCYGANYWASTSSPSINHKLHVWSWASLEENTFVIAKADASVNDYVYNVLEALYFPVNSGRDIELSSSTGSNKRVGGYYWSFIPEEAVIAQAQVNSVNENGAVTITDSPTASGTAYVKFNVSATSVPSAFTYSLTGGDGHFVLNESGATCENGVLSVPVIYTAQNVHSSATPVSTATVTVTAKNAGASTASGMASAYVDFEPRFALAVDALDWSRVGEEIVETFYSGQEIAASERDRLADKLVYAPAQTTGVAANHATWTATIIGANANQFKFANGTQTVSGPYSANLLDVHYAPTTTENHTATLHIVTTYTDAASHTETYEKDITLRGVGSAASRITFAKAGNQLPTNAESYDFGEIIGTNHKDITADLFISQITNPQMVWSDPAGQFEFNESSVNLTQLNQTLTFRAHRTAPVTENTVHTATLTISGKGTNNEDVSATLTLTYTALPLIPTTVTWNWATINENATVNNPITTNSDGVWILEKSAGDAITYDETAKTATAAYLHHEPGKTAEFVLQIPQTDTYTAFGAEYETSILAPVPEDVYIDSKAKLDEHVEYTRWEKWEDNAYGSRSLYVDNDAVYILIDGQNVLEFDFSWKSGGTNPKWYVSEIWDDGSEHKILDNAVFTVGHKKYTLSSRTVKFYVKGYGVLKDIHYYEYETIEADKEQVALIYDNGAISSMDINATFANKQQVTASLNATAAQYFEIRSEGKTTGSSMVFDSNDGLGVGASQDRLFTIALKAGANAAAARAAATGNACQLIFSDSYTYNHEELVLPIVVIEPCGITYKGSANGSYTVTYQNDGVAHVVSGTDYNKSVTTTTPADYVVTLSAPTPASGYVFQGWKINNTIVSCRETFTTSVGVDGSVVEAAFVPTEAQNFKVGDAYFAELGAALSAANTSADSKVVTLMQDVTLGEGTYTIPAGVTLLIPHKADFFELQLTPELVVNTQQVLSAYRTLTLTEGVTINCNGNICVAAKMLTAGGGQKSAYPTGEVGVINMANGGHIELNDGANLYCWGYIKGQDMDQGNNTQGTGTVTAQSGATIWEDFELGDWRGGSASLDIYNNNVIDKRKLFPFQSYAIQNIEIPTTFNYGSTLRTYTNITTGMGNHGAVFAMIGSSETMFKLEDANSVVRTWYDPTTDLTCYALSGTAKLDALHVTVYVSMSSEDFILPVSNSMHIILEDDLNLVNPLMAQAGSVIEIKPTATINLSSELYLYDKDQWGKYIHNYYFRSFNNLTSHKDRGAEDSKEGLDDAKLIVDGVLNVQNGGKIYTTAGGANVMGNNGGIIHFKQALPSPERLWAVTVIGELPYIKWEYNDATAANLCNEDGSYTKSYGGYTFYNVHGRWFDNENNNEKENHTYDFSYYPTNDVSGEETWTSAVYSHDKTGLEARMKWFNVVRTADNCTDVEDDLDKPFTSNWWIGTNPAAFYNYTMLGEWHQFMETETTNVYSASNNVLYRKAGCDWAEEGYIDENCLYTIGGVKKALVNGEFIPLTSNGYDPAYHKTDDATKYYICFQGCNWHPATPYTGESKAYTIHPEDEDLHYIWFNGDWLNVLRDEPFFYTEDEQTNVRTYYEYINGEWEIATPYVSVRDAAETRTFYMIKEAFNVAQIKKNATITLLRDIPNVAEVLTYSTQNTTCTLDLNGHSLSGNIVNLITVNAPGATFTITDNADLKIGKIGNTANKAVYVQKGTLVVANGTIESAGAYAIDGASGTTITINGGYFAATTKCVQTAGSCAISGGHFTKDANLVAYAAAHKYPFETADPKYKYEVSDAWTITFKKDETVLQTLHLKPGEMPVYTAAQPTKDGYKFVGWNNPIVAATADATYTAQFASLDPAESRVTLNSNGGNEGLQYVYVTTGSEIGTLPEGTTKDGYIFAGWWTTANGGTQLTAETTISADIIYYAHYTKASFTLTWDANGGELSGEYTHGTVEFGAAITAPTATMAGHTCLGWNATPAATMPAHDVTYTAQWSVLVKHYQQNLDGSYPASPTETEEASGEAGEYVTPAAKTYDGFITPATQTVQIGVNTEVTYQYARREYTIILDANGGECATASIEVLHGATPTLPEATKGGSNCTGWFTKAIGGDQITNETAILRNIGTLYAQYNALNVTAPLTISDTREVTDLRITTTGSLTVTGKVIADNLILEATSDVSGQLDAASEDKLDITNAFFDWKPNGETGTASRTWYAIAVPWEVDAENGIFLKETGRRLILGRDFDLIYYSGSERASVGNKPSCWKYVQHDANKTMRPGQLYMMYFDPGFKTIRFAKKADADVLYMDPVSVSTYSASDDKDANWNGIANPKTYYASLSAGSATYAQVLNNGNLDDYFGNSANPVYQTINLSSSKFTVGKPLFVQATEATSVVVTKQTTAGIVNAAPRRAAAELPKGIAAVYRLAIAGEDQPEADNLFVQVAENEKADRYTIGQDLVKGGVASGRAQVWVSRYDAKLSVNTQALSEDEATYPLTIQVPANGEYVLSIQSSAISDQTVYLTRNGEAIWNLSDGAYIGSFEKGTTSEYGLRVSARAPQITTGIDEAVVDAKGETRKVLINDQVFIIRGENVYSVDGQLVK